MKIYNYKANRSGKSIFYQYVYSGQLKQEATKNHEVTWWFDDIPDNEEEQW